MAVTAFREAKAWCTEYAAARSQAENTLDLIKRSGPDGEWAFATVRKHELKDKLTDLKKLMNPFMNEICDCKTVKDLKKMHAKDDPLTLINNMREVKDLLQNPVDMLRAVNKKLWKLKDSEYICGGFQYEGDSDLHMQNCESLQNVKVPKICTICRIVEVSKFLNLLNLQSSQGL